MSTVVIYGLINVVAIAQFNPSLLSAAARGMVASAAAAERSQVVALVGHPVRVAILVLMVLIRT